MVSISRVCQIVSALLVLTRTLVKTISQNIWSMMYQYKINAPSIFVQIEKRLVNHTSLYYHFKSSAYEDRYFTLFFFSLLYCGFLIILRPLVLESLWVL
jgi:hypothetical protein